MTVVNLIPRGRLEGQRRHRRLRRWFTAVGGYGLFLVVAMIVSTVAGSRDDIALRKELDGSSASVETASLRLDHLESELVEANALLAANRSVGNQPDWGVLLALISEAVEGKIALRKCTVRSPDPSRRLGSSDRDGAIGDARTTVELHGLAQRLEHVSDFVLLVESVPIFRDVTRHDTRREPFLGGHVVAFRLDFSIDSTGGGS